MNDNQKLQQFNKDATTVLTLYITLVSSDWHYCFLPEFELLENWLVREHTDTEWKNNKDYYEHYPNYAGPDICVHCYHWYGHTLGGRLRTGCPNCKNNESNLLFWIPNLRNRLYISDTHLEYLFANALWQWSLRGDRPREPTYKSIIEKEPLVAELVTELETL